MAFYILDQGMRVSTPLGALVGPRQVDAVTAVAAPAPVSMGGSTTAPAEGLADYRRRDAARRQPALYAQQLMQSPAETLAADQPAAAAWQLMLERRIHHLPLVDGERRLVGIISDRDLLRAGIATLEMAAEVAMRPLAALMTQRVISAGPGAELRALAEVMVSQSIGAVPIVDRDHRVLGILSRSDLLGALVAGAPVELWA